MALLTPWPTQMLLSSYIKRHHQKTNPSNFFRAVYMTCCLNQNEKRSKGTLSTGWIAECEYGWMLCLEAGSLCIGNKRKEGPKGWETYGLWLMCNELVISRQEMLPRLSLIFIWQCALDILYIFSKGYISDTPWINDISPLIIFVDKALGIMVAYWSRDLVFSVLVVYSCMAVHF